MDTEPMDTEPMDTGRRYNYGFRNGLGRARQAGAFGMGAPDTLACPRMITVKGAPGMGDAL